MHNDRVTRRTGTTLAALVVAALALSACGGGSDSSSSAGSSGSSTPASSGSGTSSAPPSTSAPAQSQSSSASVVDGVKLTAQGSKLKVGDSARVSWQPTQKTTGVIKVSVTKLQKVPISTFSDFRLTGTVRRSTPYFVHATVTNLGKSDLSNVPVPLYLLDARNTLLQDLDLPGAVPAVPQPAPARDVHARQEGVGLPGLLRPAPRQAGRDQLPPQPGLRRHHLDRPRAEPRRSSKRSPVVEEGVLRPGSRWLRRAFCARLETT